MLRSTALLLATLAALAGPAAVSAEPLVAAVPRDMPPWYELDESGRPRGFAIDVFDELARRVGVEVRYDVHPDWTSVLDALESGRADLVPTLGITPERTGRFAFSTPVEVFSMVAVMRRGTVALGDTALEGHLVGVVETNAAGPILRERGGAELQIFPHVEDAILQLLAGRLDAVVYPEPVLRKLLRDLELEKRFVFLDEPVAEVRRAIAVHPDRAELLDLFGPYIEQLIGSPEYVAIQQKWFGEPSPFWTPRRLAVTGGLLLLAVVLGMGFWRASSVLRLNRALQRSSRERELAEAKYRELVEHAGDAIFVTDGAGVYVDCNEAAVRLLGYSREELLGRHLTELIPPGDRAADPPEVERLRRGERVLRERRLLHRDGSVLDVEISARMLPDGRLLGMVRDLSESKRTALELERQARFLRLLHSVTVHVNETTSPEGAYRATLEEICRAIGWPVGHVVHVSDSRLLPSGIWWVTPSERWSTLRERTEEVGVETEVGGCLAGRVAAAGRAEWVEEMGEADLGSWLGTPRETGLRSGFAVPVFVRREPVAVLEFFHPDPRPREDDLLDVMSQIGTHLGRAVERRRIEEEREQVERRLREGQKMEAIGRLAGGIAHDFNNLLTVILGQTTLLLDRHSTPTIRPQLEAIEDGATRAAALTGQLLAFSRRQVIATRTLRLDELLDGLAPMLRRLLGEDVRVEIDGPAELWPVDADPGQIEQVIVNLAVNARDAMPQGGTLRILTSNLRLEAGDPRIDETREAGDYVGLIVSDDGVGIPPEDRERIFEPFFTTKDRGRGTGLGLATCYGIVTQSGGSIRCESEPGEGTSFTVLLPRSRSQGKPDPDATAPEDSSPTARGDETILVVEDEPAVLEFVSRVLTEAGYRVLGAESAASARPLLGGDDPEIDLLLTDLVLPGPSGTELADELREGRPELPVIFMTGHTDEAIFRRGLGETELRVLRKPFSPGALTRYVRRALDGEPAAGADA